MVNQSLLLVDDNDRFIGYERRDVCHTGQGKHHRAFVVCLFNHKKEILLQKRKHQLWDGYWDVTAISHPLHLEDHDESYEEAGLRALQVEMGIAKVSLKNIGGFNYFAKYKDTLCENEYCAVLVGDYNGNVNVNASPEVVYEYKWIDIHEFIQDCKKNPEKYAPWTILTAKILESSLYSSQE